MKLTKEDKIICDKYSERDAKGKVHCFECPLVIDEGYMICKRNISKAELKEYGMDKEKWYYFTFGSGQKYEGHYVKIYGTYLSARDEMIRRYGYKWGFQYPQEWWEQRERNKDKLPYKLETELVEE